jgi:hypothetical protein
MLREHERLCGLYLYNADLGEKRTAAYLTLISLAVAGMLGVSQLGLDNAATIELVLGVVGGIFLLGIVTFFRLVERRARSVEYLRAINRIHAYFASRDPSISPYFSWAPHDDVPEYGGKITDVTGLRDLIAILNSLFFGVMVGLLGHLITPEPREVVPAIVLLSVLASAALMIAHFWIENVTLTRAARAAQRKVRFPSPRMGDK